MSVCMMATWRGNVFRITGRCEEISPHNTVAPLNDNFIPYNYETVENVCNFIVNNMLAGELVSQYKDTILPVYGSHYKDTMGILKPKRPSIYWDRDLAPLDARTFADVMMTQFASYLYTRPAFECFLLENIYNIKLYQRLLWRTIFRSVLQAPVSSCSLHMSVT